MSVYINLWGQAVKVFFESPVIMKSSRFVTFHIKMYVCIFRGIFFAIQSGKIGAHISK